MITLVAVILILVYGLFVKEVTLFHLVAVICILTLTFWLDLVRALETMTSRIERRIK